MQLMSMAGSEVLSLLMEVLMLLLEESTEVFPLMALYFHVSLWILSAVSIASFNVFILV